MFYCYILQSLKDGRYYIGSSGNLTLRMRSHNAGIIRSTKHYLPWNLLYKEKFLTHNEALKREKYLKSLKKRKAIENLILKNKIENPR